MKKPLILKFTPIFCITLLMPIITSNTAFALATDGKMVNPAVSAKSVVLKGGSILTSKWTAPAIATYKVWVQIPSGSTANAVSYYVYPLGNSVSNTVCSSTDVTYPCFKASVDQTKAVSGWVQLTLNNDATTTWNFGKLGYVNVNASGVSKTQLLGVAQVSFEDMKATNPLTIGQAYQGGKIAYFDSTKQHGFISAAQDQTVSAMPWWNGSYAIKIATGAIIGTGQANTTAIVQAQGDSAFGPGSSYAAKLCDDLVLNSYSDWYLPSKDELNQLYINKNSIGGFVSAGYWSSTDDIDPLTGIYTGAWGQVFSVGNQYPDAMASGYKVRCVRSF